MGNCGYASAQATPSVGGRFEYYLGAWSVTMLSKVALGSVLCTAGRWTEAEAALLEALGPGASAALGHRVEASARLAELRLHQGRVDDAADLLASMDDAVAAAGPLAMLHLRRGDADLAAAVLRNAIKRMVSDVLRGGPLTALLVEAEQFVVERHRLVE